MKNRIKADKVSENYWKYFTEKPIIGLDLGSRGSKGVLLIGDEIITKFIPTGLYMQETADELIDKLLDGTEIKKSEISYIVSTGYGRISLAFENIPFEVVTEISCHAMGAHAINPGTRTIIDIGGQDSKAIKVDTNSGKVVEFVMNDKCAAGTGRFLEKAAALLGITLDHMATVALDSKNPSPISSQCVVFAESEMISLRAKGARNNDKEAEANIAAGIHLSAARRVKNLLGRVGNDSELIFTGGVSKNPAMNRFLEELIGTPFKKTSFDMMYAGALGAAVYGVNYSKETKKHKKQGNAPIAENIVHISALIEAREEEFIEADNGIKKIGYFCAYTPIEILSAFGVYHSRLFKAGNADTLAAGELITQSVFCDFSKSCVGGFLEGDGAIPLYHSIDKVYNFHTCGSMKRVTEALEEYVPVKLLNLPKNRASSDSREFFSKEIRHFAEDIEKLTGNIINDELLRERIIAYNKVRKILKNLSELRKEKNPVLLGSEFLELVRGFYIIEPEKLLPIYENLYKNLSNIPNDNKSKKLRIMLAGSIAADGDRRLIEILENELDVDIVVEDHCTGIKPFYSTIDEEGDPYIALANGYLDQAPCARMKTVEDSLEFSANLAKEYKPDGIIYVYLKFCGCYGVSKVDFVNKFNSLEIPVLDISSDYSESDHGQIKTRIEAFIEVIQAKKGSENNV